MQHTNNILFLNDSIEISLGCSQFRIINSSNTDSHTLESKIVDSNQTELEDIPIKFVWDNWAASHLEINGETLILHRNGDAQHTGYIHNGSGIHHKNVSLKIIAKRVSTGAVVFTFGYFGAYLTTNHGTPFDVNRFYQEVKENWGDIVSGNMSFEPEVGWTDRHRIASE